MIDGVTKKESGEQKDPRKVAIGQRIRELRLALRGNGPKGSMTQREFATFVGMDTDQTISRWEGGETTPSKEVLDTIEEKTGVSPRYILRGEGTPVAAPQVLEDFFGTPAGQRLTFEQRRGLIMLLRDKDIDAFRIEAAVELLFPATARPTPQE